jgi:hypothetical protein
MLGKMALLSGVLWAIGSACMISGARAESPASLDIAGRWEQVCEAAPTCVTRIDISRCDAGWCGVGVKTDGTCGAPLLELGSGKQRYDDGSQHFEGKVTLAAGTAPYIVDAHVSRDVKDGTMQLRIAGNTEGNLIRRIFEFDARLARTDLPVCTASKPAA